MNRRSPGVDERVRALLNGLPTLIWTARPDGRVDYANRRWTDYTGLDLAQTLGTGWEAAIHPDDLRRTRPLWLSAYNFSAGAP